MSVDSDGQGHDHHDFETRLATATRCRTICTPTSFLRCKSFRHMAHVDRRPEVELRHAEHALVSYRDLPDEP